MPSHSRQLLVVGTPRRAASMCRARGRGSQWVHALGHLTVGVIVASLLLWGGASLTLWIRQKVARRKALA